MGSSMVDGTEHVSGDVYYLDLGTFVWTRVPGQDSERSLHSAYLCRNFMVIVAGRAEEKKKSQPKLLARVCRWLVIDISMPMEANN